MKSLRGKPDGDRSGSTGVPLPPERTGVHLKVLKGFADSGPFQHRARKRLRSPSTRRLPSIRNNSPPVERTLLTPHRSHGRPRWWTLSVAWKRYTAAALTGRGVLTARIEQVCRYSLKPHTEGLQR